MTKPIREYAWEYFFNEEALRVEEILSGGGISDYEKSRLRLAFEAKILNWQVYKQWFLGYHGCAAIRDDLTAEEITYLHEIYIKNFSQFNKMTFQNSDLIALQTWEGHTVILGLNYSESLKKVPHALFVLCSPEILTQIIDPQSSREAIDLLWSQTESKHFDYSSQARKNFDGFVTLKITGFTTELFKMDEDLAKENLDSKVFSFALNENNPFSQAFKSGQSQAFSMDSLGLKILDYSSAVITPLKKGKNIVGFLLGLKMTEVGSEDAAVLETISTQAS